VAGFADRDYSGRSALVLLEKRDDHLKDLPLLLPWQASNLLKYTLNLPDRA